MTNGSIPDILAHSVTRNDHTPAAGGVFWLMSSTLIGPTSTTLPEYWSPQRDYVLSATVRLEAMWSAAIGKAITKQAALGWKVSDTNDSDLRTKRAQALLHQAEGGQGWVTFLSKHLRDYLTCDNGAFIEVVRATPAYGSKIIGLMHLDSHRCTRTGDLSTPLLYRDLQSNEHVLNAHQVLMFSDMPDPSESYRGVGYSAASRAWKTIVKLAGIETYITEKVTGSRPTEIHLVSGITAKQLEGALITAAAEQKRNGLGQYQGALVVPGIDPTVPPSVASIALSSIPDGFDAKQERDNAYLIYANAIGIPVQDIQPLSGQGLGTGTQTIILDEAAEGQGLAAWRKQFEHAMNEFVLPETTTFIFATNDIRDQKAKADVQSIRATTRQTQVTSGEINADQARQIAADEGDVPREFLTEDQTPGGSLADDEKPIEEAAPAMEAVPPAPSSEPIPVPPQIETKAKKPSFTAVAALLDDELDAATALYEEVTHGDDK